MKIALTAGGVGAIAGIAAVGALALVLYDYLQKNRDKFNPGSDKNVAYGAASSVARAVFGDVVDARGRPIEATVGTRLYAWIHGDSMPEIDKPVTQADIDAYRRGRGAQAPAPAPSDPLDVIAQYMM